MGNSTTAGVLSLSRSGLCRAKGLYSPLEQGHDYENEAPPTCSSGFERIPCLQVLRFRILGRHMGNAFLRPRRHRVFGRVVRWKQKRFDTQFFINIDYSCSPNDIKTGAGGQIQNDGFSGSSSGGLEAGAATGCHLLFPTPAFIPLFEPSKKIRLDIYKAISKSLLTHAESCASDGWMPVFPFLLHRQGLGFRVSGLGDLGFRGPFVPNMSAGG